MHASSTASAGNSLLPGIDAPSRPQRHRAQRHDEAVVTREILRLAGLARSQRAGDGVLAELAITDKHRALTVSTVERQPACASARPPAPSPGSRQSWALPAPRLGRTRRGVRRDTDRQTTPTR